MSKNVKRGKSEDILLSISGEEKTLSKEKFFQEYGISEAIRIQEKDYEFIKEGQKILTHFNLQVTYHKVGHIYALPKILRHGYFKEGHEEVLPLLDFENCFMAKCTGVRESVPYSALKKEDFENSLGDIKNVEDLKKEILYRYGKSMPGLSAEEILNLGVSITTLELLGRFKHK